MIHYHGGPITPVEAAIKIWKGKHGFISFEYPEQLEIIAEWCQSFALDNGAFSAWKKNKIINWNLYY